MYRNENFIISVLELFYTGGVAEQSDPIFLSYLLIEAFITGLRVYSLFPNADTNVRVSLRLLAKEIKVAKVIVIHLPDREQGRSVMFSCIGL